MSDVIGPFYFKLTANNNLIGEFTNNLSENYISESAIRKNSDTGSEPSFIGEYHSTWFDKDENKAILADLEITKKDDLQNIFSLIWVDTNGNTFKGLGMLCDNLLIGSYQAV